MVKEATLGMAHLQKTGQFFQVDIRNPSYIFFSCNQGNHACLFSVSCRFVGVILP